MKNKCLSLFGIDKQKNYLQTCHLPVHLNFLLTFNLTFTSSPFQSFFSPFLFFSNFFFLLLHFLPLLEWKVFACPFLPLSPSNSWMIVISRKMHWWPSWDGVVVLPFFALLTFLTFPTFPWFLHFLASISFFPFFKVFRETVFFLSIFCHSSHAWTLGGLGVPSSTQEPGRILTESDLSKPRQKIMSRHTEKCTDRIERDLRK